jgi:F-type H+-transporting ATPase subunit delta
MDESRQSNIFDTDQQQLGEIYATALIGLGQKRGLTPTWIEQLAAVIDVLDAVPKLKALLQSPGIAVGEKVAVLKKAFVKKVDNDLLNFLTVVLSKGRFDCLSAIRGAAVRQFDELSGRVRGTITTALEIDEQVRQRVEGQLATKFGKTIQLASRVDPSIIGGIVVRIGDTVYDASVRNRLNQVRTKAIKRTADSIRSSLDSFVAN